MMMGESVMTPRCERVLSTHDSTRESVLSGPMGGCSPCLQGRRHVLALSWSTHWLFLVLKGIRDRGLMRWDIERLVYMRLMGWDP